jgi:hypothetical protein
MYLFSRWATLAGNPRSSMGWALEAAAFVADKCGREMSTWSVEFGAPVGTVAWTTRVDSLADLNALFAPLANDDGWFDMIDKGAEFMTTGSQDRLREVVRAPADPALPPVGSVATLITAVSATGMMAAAMEWGGEVAAYVETLTGQPTLFLADAFDDFGRLSWIGVAADHAAADASNGKLAADPGYLERLGRTGDLFLAGSGHSTLLSRIG